MGQILGRGNFQINLEYAHARMGTQQDTKGRLILASPIKKNPNRIWKRMDFS